MKKRILCSILAAMLIVTLFAGCTGGDEEQLDIDLSAIEGLEGDLCSKEPLTLTVHFHNGANGIFNDETWDIYHKAAEWTNISLHGTVSQSQSDSEQAFNLMLSASPLPDIVFKSLDKINDAGMNEGAFIPLEKYVTSKKLMPNLAKIFEEHPEYLTAITAPDGHVYMCPKIREPGPTQGWYTRSDWMEKLGLKDPVTYDDFVNVMDAFRNQDPNGNGKKDEVPYFGTVGNLFYFFGLNGARYMDVNDKDEFYLTRTTEDYKTALITIADWYKKGYIDQEIFTRKNPRGELWGNNVGGMTFNWFSSTMSYNTQIKSIPGFHVSVMMPPQNNKGVAYCHSPGDVVQTSGWGITVDNQHIAETLKYFDFWYSEKGSLLNAMGIEGRDYEYGPNGEPHYTDLALNYEGGAPNYVRSIGCQDIGYYMRQKWLVSGMTEEAAEGLQAYIDADFTCPLLPLTNFTDEEQILYDQKWTACQTYIDEYQQNAILGNVDVEATWDEYCAQVEKLGASDVIKIKNDAYDRYKKAVNEKK